MRDEVPPTRRLNIFMCHASDDKPAVRQLYDQLQHEGFDPWLDEEDLLPGQDWRHEIGKAVRAADVVLVCLSRKSINKNGYVQKEIRIALEAADQMPEGRSFLIPVKLEDCSVPERFSSLHWVDLTAPGAQARLFKSLRAVAAEGLVEATETQQSEKAWSIREAPFSIADLSETGGLELTGYKVYQGLKLTNYSNGIDGSILVLIDERINGLTGGMLKDAYSGAETLHLQLDPTIWSLEPGEVRQALLLVVDRELRTLYHEQLGRESARLDRVYLYPDRSKPTFIVTRDYSIGWGSYNGPISYFLEVSANAGIRYVLTHGLMTSLKTAWVIVASDQGPAEILSKKCRPNFAASSPNENLKFQVIYERFHLDGSSWQPMLVEEDGFWEADRGLDAAEIRAKFGIEK